LVSTNVFVPGDRGRSGGRSQSGSDAAGAMEVQVTKAMAATQVTVAMP
jgi:hypothetical protein